jgi:hypothetical protein
MPTVPYTFATQTGNIPLSELDANFSVLASAVPPYANTSGTVTSNVQANINTLGTLTTLSVTGNITGNYILGNGSQLTGLSGFVGATGPQGDIGATGPQGDIGATGPQGPIGATGATGATGPQGPQGLTGATGAGSSNAALLTGNTLSSNVTISSLTAVGTLTSLSVTGNITANNFVGGGAGTPTLSSATNLDLSAVTAVRVTGGGTFRLPSLSTGQRDALIAANGDMIYNTTASKIQGYENGAWGNLI